MNHHATQASSAPTDHAPQPAPDGSVAGGEFLTFALAEEEYGVDILKVQEIRGYDAVTRLPDAPAHIKGVIYLRGTIVPVVDMRVKFRLARADYGPTTVMIVLNVGGRIVGMVVDSVSDVIRLSDAQVRPVPDVGCPIERRFLTGIGTLDERMLILLDIERLMASTEMGLVMEEAA
jgi:purine-binding chemotaxis protein CheW